MRLIDAAVLLGALTLVPSIARAQEVTEVEEESASEAADESPPPSPAEARIQKKGRGMVIGGAVSMSVLLSASVALSIAAASIDVPSRGGGSCFIGPCFRSPSDEEAQQIGLAVGAFLAGGAGLGIGIPLIVAGTKRQRAPELYAASSPELELQVGPGTLLATGAF